MCNTEEDEDKDCEDKKCIESHPSKNPITPTEMDVQVHRIIFCEVKDLLVVRDVVSCNE